MALARGGVDVHRLHVPEPLHPLLELLQALGAQAHQQQLEHVLLSRGQAHGVGENAEGPATLGVAPTIEGLHALDHTLHERLGALGQELDAHLVPVALDQRWERGAHRRDLAPPARHPAHNERP